MIFDTITRTEVTHYRIDNPIATLTRTPVLSWSPTGEWLATNLICLKARGSAAVLFNTLTGEMHPHLYSAEWALTAKTIAWRPDGGACLISIRHPQQSKLTWWNPWGGVRERTCALTAPEATLSPHFSRDCSMFAFVAVLHLSHPDAGRAGGVVRGRMHGQQQLILAAV